MYYDPEIMKIVNKTIDEYTLKEKEYQNKSNNIEAKDYDCILLFSRTLFLFLSCILSGIFIYCSFMIINNTSSTYELGLCKFSRADIEIDNLALIYVLNANITYNNINVNKEIKKSVNITELNIHKEYIIGKQFKCYVNNNNILDINEYNNLKNNENSYLYGIMFPISFIFLIICIIITYILFKQKTYAEEIISIKKEKLNFIKELDVNV